MRWPRRTISPDSERLPTSEEGLANSWQRSCGPISGFAGFCSTCLIRSKAPANTSKRPVSRSVANLLVAAFSNLCRAAQMPTYSRRSSMTWDDEHSIKILKNCRLAMNDTAKLLVADRIIPQRLEATSEHRSFAMMDLTMMVLLGSRERSEEEFRRLLSAGGFKLVSCAIKLPGDRRLIEADCA